MSVTRCTRRILTPLEADLPGSHLTPLVFLCRAPSRLAATFDPTATRLRASVVREALVDSTETRGAATARSPCCRLAPAVAGRGRPPVARGPRSAGSGAALPCPFSAVPVSCCVRLAAGSGGRAAVAWGGRRAQVAGRRAPGATRRSPGGAAAVRGRAAVVIVPRWRTTDGSTRRDAAVASESGRRGDPRRDRRPGPSGGRRRLSGDGRRDRRSRDRRSARHAVRTSCGAAPSHRGGCSWSGRWPPPWCRWERRVSPARVWPAPGSLARASASPDARAWPASDGGRRSSACGCRRDGGWRRDGGPSAPAAPAGC